MRLINVCRQTPAASRAGKCSIESCFTTTGTDRTDLLAKFTRRLFGQGADAFTGGIGPAASVINSRAGRPRRQVGERFGVGTLRASGPVELREGRIVSEKRLQTRRLRREQLDLGVEDIQLHPCASVEPGFGQANRYCFCTDAWVSATIGVTSLPLILMAIVS